VTAQDSLTGCSPIWRKRSDRWVIDGLMAGATRSSHTPAAATGKRAGGPGAFRQSHPGRVRDAPPRRWDTDRVGRTGRRARRRWNAARWVLLAAVLAGLFGMHVLTAEDSGSGGHGLLPMIATSAHDGLTDPARATTRDVPATIDAADSGAVLLPAAPGSGGDHGAMAGCILFLVIGGAALILALLRHRGAPWATGLGRLAGIALTDLRRRGPPAVWPRLALCVIRV